jgi:tryptophan synthase beta subunit
MSMVREIRELMGRISKVEQQVSKLPSRISSAVGGSGSGSGGWEPYVVDTREDLPADPPSGSLGFVESGDYAGGWFTHYDGEWHGLNFWEQAP